MKHILTCSGHELKIPNIMKAEGITIYDDNGKRYLDLESGIWCTSLGHGNARVNQVIKDQIDRLMHAGFCYSNPVVEASAQSVLDLAGFTDGKAVFLCSGSEAIEISRQMAKHLTDRSKSMTLHDSYLGSYSSVKDRSRDWYLFNWEKCQNCEVKETCDRNCELLTAIPEDLGEFIFEPGSSSGFVRFPPRELIRNIVDIVRQNGGKIIANEVTTGIGRTGRWFGYQHYGITPDFVAVGKGIGNGYPVSVALIHPDISGNDKLQSFRYAQSHQNDPLGAAVAKEVVQVIHEQDLISNAETVGKYLNEHLQGLVDGDFILEVRGRGLMLAVELKNEDIAKRFHQKLFEKGILVVNRGTFLRIDPPLIISNAEVNEFVASCAEIQRGLK